MKVRTEKTRETMTRRRERRRDEVERTWAIKLLTTRIRMQKPGRIKRVEVETSLCSPQGKEK